MGPGAGTATRARLLEAAKLLFSERGYQATSTRALAAHAGCNVAMIKHYFGSKEGLFRELVASRIRETSAELESILALDLPAEERLRRHVDYMVDLLERDRDFLRIVLRELMADDCRFVDDLAPLIERNLRLFEKLLAAARAEGRLRDVEPGLAAMLLMAMIHHYFLHYPMASRIHGPATPERIRELKRNILEIFLGGAFQDARREARRGRGERAKKRPPAARASLARTSARTRSPTPPAPVGSRRKA